MLFKKSAQSKLKKKNRNSSVWCYLTRALVSTTLMTIRHDSLNADGMGDGEAMWNWNSFAVMKNKLLWALFHNWPDWRCQKVKVFRTSSSGLKKWPVDFSNQENTRASPAFFDALSLTGLLEKYELFIVHESYNPSGDYTGMRNRLLNFSIWKKQRLKQSANHVAMPSNAFSRVVATIRQERW